MDEMLPISAHFSMTWMDQYPNQSPTISFECSAVQIM